MAQNVLLVIDAQVNQFHPEYGIADAPRIRQTIAELVDRARTSGTPIIFVRHDGGEDAIDGYGEPLWELEPGIGYVEGDPIVDKTQYDAFAGTNLQQILFELGAEVVTIAGMQTDYCIGATTRRAAELGYGVVLVSDAHGTADADIPAAETVATFNSLAQDFAQVVPAAEVEFV